MTFGSRPARDVAPIFFGPVAQRRDLDPWDQVLERDEARRLERAHGVVLRLAALEPERLGHERRALARRADDGLVDVFVDLRGPAARVRVARAGRRLA